MGNAINTTPLISVAGSCDALETCLSLLSLTLSSWVGRNRQKILQDVQAPCCYYDGSSVEFRGSAVLSVAPFRGGALTLPQGRWNSALEIGT